MVVQVPLAVINQTWLGWGEGRRRDSKRKVFMLLKRATWGKAQRFYETTCDAWDHSIHLVVMRTASLTKDKICHIKYDRAKRRKIPGFLVTFLSHWTNQGWNWSSLGLPDNMRKYIFLLKQVKWEISIPYILCPIRYLWPFSFYRWKSEVPENYTWHPR